MHALWRIDMHKDWKKQLSDAPSASDFQKVLKMWFSKGFAINPRCVIFKRFCNTILDPATCKHVGHPTQQYV